MILTHGASSLPRGGDSVIIGGRTYRTVTIGTQTWLAENLDFKFSGLVVGADGTSSSEPRGNYYDNDESTYGANGNKYGLLYNWTAAKYIEDNKSSLVPGWHVPTMHEWSVLIEEAGGRTIENLALRNLMSRTGWPEDYPEGEDSYGFTALPAGGYTAEDDFGAAGEAAFFWTSSTVLNNYVTFFLFSDSISDGRLEDNDSSQISIRLVKDA